MEKDSVATSPEDQATKKESRKRTSHQPKNLGSLAVEAKPETDSGQSKRRRGTEANQLHGSKPSPEHIGHMLMTVETESGDEKSDEKISSTGERASETPESTRQLLEGKHIETLNRAQLMDLSDKIIVDGSSLRQIYETHLIGERGLRRLIDEYLHGGDLKKALHSEIIEREMDFERDPAMRDLAPYQLPTAAASDGGQAALDKLLKHNNLNVDDTGDRGDRNEEAAFLKARIIYDAKQTRQHRQRQRLLDIALALIIALLLTIIIALFVSRR